MATAPSDNTAKKVVFAATIGNIVSITPAISATFGIFLVPISEEFGWLRSSVSGVLTLLAIISAVIYPLAGKLADRIGARRIILTGNLLMAPAIAALALSSGSIWQFYLTFALIGCAGGLCGTVIYSKVVSDWFDKNRGLALGIAAGVGNGVGSTIMPIVAGLVLAAYGWRTGYLTVAMIVLIVGFPILFTFLKDAASHKTVTLSEGETAPEVKGLTLKQSMAEPAFWILLIAVAASAGAMTALFTHVVPVLTDRSFSLAIATSVTSAFALMTAIWQVATGAVLDRFQSAKVIIPMYAVAILGIYLLYAGDSTALVIAAGILLGIGMGAEYGAMPYFISRFFGMKHYGEIAGIMYGVVILSQGLAPFLMDVSFDMTASYDLSLLTIAIVLAASAVLVAFLPPFEALEERERKAELARLAAAEG